MEEVSKGESVEEKMLPKFDYYIDESDSDIVALRRQDGSFVAAFSARGATSESIAEAAKEDYFKLVEVHAGSLNLRENHAQERDSAKRSTA
jgi:hypothetical protein